MHVAPTIHDVHSSLPCEDNELLAVSRSDLVLRSDLELRFDLVSANLSATVSAWTMVESSTGLSSVP